jgi:hypothetical protein
LGTFFLAIFAKSLIVKARASLALVLKSEGSFHSIKEAKCGRSGNWRLDLIIVS